MAFLASVFANVLAFAMLAASMRKHHERVFRRELLPALRARLRAGGWILLGASLAWLAAVSVTPSVGIVLFAPSLMIAGWVVALALAFAFREPA